MPYTSVAVHMQDQSNANPHTDFGFKKVNTELKTPMIQSLFQNIASNYDLMNDLMSLGLHRLWKKHFIKQIALRQNYQILDVAGGTGDISIELYKKNQYLSPSIYVCDLTFNMVHEGKLKSFDKGIHQINWHNGNAENLPYKGASFDVVTIAFGLRNVTDKPQAMREMARVLKPGGKLYCLEFSNTEQPIKSLYDLYSFKIIPLLGKFVARNQDAYQYLVESIRTFPKADDLKSMFLANSFKNCSFQKLNSGIVAIHTCTK